MCNYFSEISKYLSFCEYQKNLDRKTVKAYGIDLKQFFSFYYKNEDPSFKPIINEFIGILHTKYKPKTVKRKVASIKAFCSYLEEEEIIDINPFTKIKINYKEPLNLPKTISLDDISIIFTAMYEELKNNDSEYQQGLALRNIAAIELLFATGIRVSELCSLLDKNVDLKSKNIRILGKGAKERILQIENPDVLDILRKYSKFYQNQINTNGYFFVNRLGNKLSEQSVRLILNKYRKKTNLGKHITPHMLRHSFATLLLEEDVDIRYIQKILGHSSITTTQIYTHVASAKQKEILLTKHPRNKIVCG